MEILKKMLSNRRAYYTTFLTILLTSILLQSCKRQDEDLQPAAALTVVNLVPGNSSIDFYLNNRRVNGASMLYLQSLRYFNIFPGLQKFDVTIGGTFQALATDTVTVRPGNYHSLFILENSSVELLLTSDDLSDPPAGKTKIRFVNLSPDAPNVDVTASGGTVLFNNQGFKSATNFITVDPANYTFAVEQAGEGTEKAISPSVKLDAGKIYTIIAFGSWNGTAQKAFAVDLMEN